MCSTQTANIQKPVRGIKKAGVGGNSFQEGDSEMGISIRELIQKARWAQQDNVQQHDVQLEMRPPEEFRIDLLGGDRFEASEWPTSEELTSHMWDEVEDHWWNYELTYDPEHAREDAERKDGIS